MANYNYYDDAVSGAALPFEARRHGVVLKKRMNAVDIIASDTTLTANAKITANDVIRMIRFPADFLFKDLVVKVVTRPAATCTVDFGLAGGQEAGAAIELDVAAGTLIQMLHTETWGATNGQTFAAADTLDVQYLADTTTADFLLYVMGFMLW